MKTSRGESIPGRGDSKCKGPGLGISLQYWRDLKGQEHWILFYLRWAALEGFMQGNVIIYMFILVYVFTLLLAAGWGEDKGSRQRVR